MKISEIFTYFTDTIFRRDINEWRNPVIRWLVQQYRLLFYTARGLLEHGTEQALGLAQRAMAAGRGRGVDNHQPEFSGFTTAWS